MDPETEHPAGAVRVDQLARRVAGSCAVPVDIGAEIQSVVVTPPVARPAAPSPVDVARLEALADVATPGPWVVEVRGGIDSTGEGWSTLEVSFDGGGDHVPGVKPGLAMGDHEAAEVDAEFIAELRNAAESLLADHRAVERVRALCDAAERGWADLTRVDLSHTGSPAVMVDRIRAALDGAE